MNNIVLVNTEHFQSVGCKVVYKNKLNQHVISWRFRRINNGKHKIRAHPSKFTLEYHGTSFDNLENQSINKVFDRFWS